MTTAPTTVYNRTRPATVLSETLAEGRQNVFAVVANHALAKAHDALMAAFVIGWQGKDAGPWPVPSEWRIERLDLLGLGDARHLLDEGYSLADALAVLPTEEEMWVRGRALSLEYTPGAW